MQNTLKSLLLLVAALSAAAMMGLATAKSQFCAGFEHGFVTGYKQAKRTSFDPFVPFCPFQPFKEFGDPQSDYEHGYTIGYKEGLAKGSQ